MPEVEYRTIEGVPNKEVLSLVLKVSDDAFSNKGDITEYQRHLAGKRNILTCLALNNGEPVGFKIGYEDRQHYFESWRGGVVENARRKGIADQLTRHQHAWCEQQGFRIITTICSNENVAMLILNFRHGLRITGSYFDRGQHLKLILQKHLT
ncbi:MAG: GNAT family N-acetyltransferase [Deltaproteobacteria bacterium]|nr:GNAT family N-acetyltransferase [Deltaproteobacteria bacterium]